MGYKINNEAIEEYKKISGDIFEWGILVSSPKASGTQPLALKEGSLCASGNGVLMARQDGIQYTCVDIKVKGITKDMNGSELIMALYVRDGNTIYYLTEQGQSTSADTVKIEV